jgi:hypothetical protein
LGRYFVFFRSFSWSSLIMIKQALVVVCVGVDISPLKNVINVTLKASLGRRFSTSIFVLRKMSE